MASYIRHLALTHLYDARDGSEASKKAKRVEMILRDATPGLHARPYEDVVSLFDGLALVSPALVLFDSWWPDGPTTPSRNAPMGIVLGGVGKKMWLVRLDFVDLACLAVPRGKIRLLVRQLVKINKARGVRVAQLACLVPDFRGIDRSTGVPQLHSTR